MGETLSNNYFSRNNAEESSTGFFYLKEQHLILKKFSVRSVIDFYISFSEKRRRKERGETSLMKIFIPTRLAIVMKRKFFNKGSMQRFKGKTTLFQFVSIIRNYGRNYDNESY